MEYAPGQFPGDVTIATANNPPVIVVPGCPTRRTLIFGSLTSVAFVVNTSNPGATGLGILIPANTKALVMNYTDWGELVRKPWFGWASAGATTIAWAEVLDG